MTHVYWFITGFVVCQALNIWWFHGNLKETVDGWKAALAAKIKGLFS